jgi:hypothetical protein
MTGTAMKRTTARTTIMLVITICDGIQVLGSDAITALLFGWAYGWRP